MPYEYGDCTQASYHKKGGGVVKVQNSLYNSFSGKVDEAIGSATCDGPKCKVGFFLFRTGDYRVVATDYTNYAIVTSCNSYLFFRYEIIWVLSRTETLDASTKTTVDNIIKDKMSWFHFDSFHYTK